MATHDQNDPRQTDPRNRDPNDPRQDLGRPHTTDQYGRHFDEHGSQVDEHGRAVKTAPKKYYRVAVKNSGPISIPLQHHFEEIPAPPAPVVATQLVPRTNVKALVVEPNKPVVVELEDRLVADLRLNPNLEITESSKGEADKDETKRNGPPAKASPDRPGQADQDQKDPRDPGKGETGAEARAEKYNREKAGK